MIHKEIAVRLIQLLGGEDNVISAGSLCDKASFGD